MRISQAVIVTFLGCLVAACGDSGNSQDAASDLSGSTASGTAATLEPADLCETAATEIQALTPEGAEPLGTPGLDGISTSRMCIIHYGIDAPVQQIREFYEASLAKQGYELSRNEITDGAMPTNESRTFILGANSNRIIGLVIDEFSVKRQGRFSVTIQMQLDAT